MSVIAGIVMPAGRQIGPEMLEELAPPQAEGVATTTWIGGHVALLHATEGVGSETVPGYQPRAAGDVVVVFDGRLDARSELLAALDGGAAADASDPDLVLAAYERWGIDAPRHLVGDFAFGVWDAPNGRLLLARDPVGGRTLFVSEWGTAFRFGSTLEQLLRVRGIPHDVDEQSLARFIYGDSRPGERNSFYREIVPIGGGSMLIASPRTDRVESTLRRYWAWPTTAPDIRPLTAEDDERFRDVFTAAVADRLRTNAPAAILLSGGLDSGAVASVAGTLAQGASAGPKVYSVAFDTPRFAAIDERRYSREVADRYGLEWHAVPADDAWPFELFEEWRPVFSEPTFAPYDGALYVALAAARRGGSRTVLMGHLGDLVVGGSSLWFAELLRRGSLRELATQVRHHAQRGGRSVVRTLGATALFRLFPVALQRSIDRRQAGLAPGWLASDVARRLDVDTRPMAHGGRDAWWKELRYLFGLMGQSRGTGYMDRLLRRFGVEQRQPFLDTRLLTLMLALPPQALYSDGRQKTILRRSLRDVLPPAVRDRTDKASFAPLAEYGLRGPYRPFVVSLLESSEIAALGMVEPRAWRRSVELFLDGGVPLNWPTWRSLAAEMWLRHLGGRLPTPLPRSRVDLAP